MKKFNFIHDPIPAWLRNVARGNVPRRLHGPITVVLTALAFLGGAVIAERHRTAQAWELAREARERLQRSGVIASDIKLRRDRLDALLREDQFVQNVRATGPEMAATLSAAGNLFPRESLLDSLDVTDGGYTMKGKSATVPAVAELTRRLLTNWRYAGPRSIRVSLDEGTGLIAFEIDSK